MIKCIVIDDEPLARECIVNYINEVDFLQVAGQGSTPLELTEILDKTVMDLLFLDIQMPQMNGIEFLKISESLPMVILTTAYPSYALEGYELNVLDYLLKPITFNRFFKSALKAKEQYMLQNQTLNTQQTLITDIYFFIKCNGKYEKVYFDAILFIQAMQNYVIIYTREQKFITLLNLKSVAQYLDANMFLQVHKSYIVSVPKIDRLESHEIMIHDHKIPISRNFRKEVVEQIVGNKLWKNNH
ncbi:LytTR family DNA-binding domain-containing protein [Algoriphagus sp. D3-2-R+10]|uniref:LytR/AlgR family response regulator transcription factor n=1 Tax=Algoriphagus aurantiacus TaxID=3103948 RepID=UPI002B3F561A|nr:LytTR family DNA-binding domain-containing protein [Algoriphagus sp. D3-2-R+10]MEB2776392.1 LytTR family DNA-binding domain-containing protein [Algoriphagus sp. D3-2-R+10]